MWLKAAQGFTDMIPADGQSTFWPQKILAHPVCPKFWCTTILVDLQSGAAIDYVDLYGWFSRSASEPLCKRREPLCKTWPDMSWWSVRTDHSCRIKFFRRSTFLLTNCSFLSNSRVTFEFLKLLTIGIFHSDLSVANRKGHGFLFSCLYNFGISFCLPGMFQKSIYKVFEFLIQSQICQ